MSKGKKQNNKSAGQLLARGVSKQLTATSGRALEKVFSLYCSEGDSSDSAVMNETQFLHLVDDAALLDNKRVSRETADNTYLQSLRLMKSGAFQWREFLVGVALLSDLKYPNHDPRRAVEITLHEHVLRLADGL